MRTDVAEANDDHGFLGTKFDSSQLVLLLGLKLLIVFNVFRMVKHAKCDELAEDVREGTSDVVQRNGTGAEIFSCNISFDTSGEGLHPLDLC